jgi:hypothetical protein
MLSHVLVCATRKLLVCVVAHYQKCMWSREHVCIFHDRPLTAMNACPCPRLRLWRRSFPDLWIPSTLVSWTKVCMYLCMYTRINVQSRSLSLSVYVCVSRYVSVHLHAHTNFLCGNCSLMPCTHVYIHEHAHMPHKSSCFFFARELAMPNTRQPRGLLLNRSIILP